MRYPFVDNVLYLFGKTVQNRQYLGNNAVPATAVFGWLSDQKTAVGKYPNRGMLPNVYQGTIVTPQAVLKGVSPLDNALAAIRAQQSVNIRGE